MPTSQDITKQMNLGQTKLISAKETSRELEIEAPGVSESQVRTKNRRTGRWRCPDPFLVLAENMKLTHGETEPDGP